MMLDAAHVKQLQDCILNFIRILTNDLFVPPAEIARIDSNSIHADEIAFTIFNCTFNAAGIMPADPNVNLKLLSDLVKKLQKMALK